MKRMQEKQHLIRSIAKRLQSTSCLPHFASALAYDIYVLITKFDLNEFEKIKMINAFQFFLKNTNNENIIVNQLNYALNLVNHSMKLEYEEIHKVFALVDEIYALKNIGLDWNVSCQSEFEITLNNLFKKEPNRSKMVAKDRFEIWKKDWWWYK